MKKLLVTTDLSANSKSAIRFAQQLARQNKASLLFLHVAAVTKPTAWTDKHYKRFEQENTERLLPKLKDFVAKAAGAELPDADYRIGFGLDVPKVIITAAKKWGADGICLSTRGAGRVKKLFGTTASAIVTSSPTPVIVVPQRYTPTPVTNIFFACDFAALAREMKYAEALSEELTAELNVYHYDYLLDVSENRRKLETRAEKFSSARTHFHFRKLAVERSLADHLNKEIKKEKPGLVLLFTKQDRNWLDRLLLPSEASTMAFQPTVPLLTFKKK